MTEHSSAHALLQQLQSWKIFLTLLSPPPTSSRRGKMTNISRKYIHWGNRLHLQCWGVLIWIWWCLFLFGVQNSGPTARGSFKCQMETKQSWDCLILVTQGCYMCLYIDVCVYFCVNMFYFTIKDWLHRQPIRGKIRFKSLKLHVWYLSSPANTAGYSKASVLPAALGTALLLFFRKVKQLESC